MTGSTLFIVNPAAGAGRAGKLWARIWQDRAAGEFAPSTIVTTRPGEAISIAQEAASKYDRVIAVGGDGTVSEVAEGLLRVGGHQCALGIIPVGTGNDLAGTMGIRRLRDAIEVLAEVHSRVIDVIEVHCVANDQPLHRHALSFAGVGIIGPVLRNTTRRAKRLLGRVGAYRFGLLQALWQYRSPHMNIVCDEVVSKNRCLFLGVSNGETAGGGMRIAPGARMDDGLLNVNLVGAVTRWEALKQLRKLSQGRHTSHPQVRYCTATTITIESDPVSDVAADGEIIGQTPARFLLKPKALRVIGHDL
jgi:YegS/Rv2252/BmrU family lipid kinase